MIPTAVEPIVFCSAHVDDVCPQDYPNTYGHIINSFSFDLEALTLFITVRKQQRNFANFVSKNYE